MMSRTQVLLRDVLRFFFEGEDRCCYAALIRPKKVETRLQLQMGS